MAQNYTDRARALGWTIPDGFQVLAWMQPDENDKDPRDEADVYRTDVDEDDYDNPTHGFCAHCGRWITLVTGGERPEDGPLWRAVEPPLFTCDAVNRPHELAPPLAVQMFFRKAWQFVGVIVEVRDESGRLWSGGSLWGLEAGRYPTKIDPATGLTEIRLLNPLTDDYPLCELLPEALSEAAKALAEHAAKAPAITAPTAIESIEEPS